MIEYTINPIEYKEEDATLIIAIIPLGTPLLKTQTVVLAMTPELLAKIGVESDVAVQKAILRREIIGFNESLQGAWAREQAILSFSVPAQLTELLGIPGTTAVTEAELAAIAAEDEALIAP